MIPFASSKALARKAVAAMCRRHCAHHLAAHTPVAYSCFYRKSRMERSRGAGGGRERMEDSSRYSTPLQN